MYEKLKNYSIKSFKECLFFVFCLFCFLLLSNNTLHVIFYTYIRYGNTFQYGYIIQITYHIVKQSHARVTLKDICLLFSILFLCLFSFCLNFVLFHEALLLLCCLIDLVYCYSWQLYNSFTHLRYFLTFLLFVFIDK